MPRPTPKPICEAFEDDALAGESPAVEDGLTERVVLMVLMVLMVLVKVVDVVAVLVEVELEEELEEDIAVETGESEILK